MTAIGITDRTGACNCTSEAHDWKRRSERLVRASRRPCTIVRPSWFDHNVANQHRLVFLQGDTRQACDPSDGVLARHQIAEVLLRSLASASAIRKTFERVAERGPAPSELDLLFANLEADAPGALDAC